MSYIEESLFDGERILYRSGLHWAFLLLSGIFSGLFLLAGVLLMVEGFSVGVLIVVICVGVIAKEVIVWNTTEMAITSNRVIVKVGVLSRNVVELLLSKVESVVVKQGLFERMLGYGCVIVEGTGGTVEPFTMVRSPMEFRRQVQRALASIR